MGLAAAGSCVGGTWTRLHLHRFANIVVGITYVALARHLLERSGLRTTMLVIGAVVTVGMIPPNLVFRMRGQRPRSASRKRHEQLFRRRAYNWRTHLPRIAHSLSSNSIRSLTLLRGFRYFHRAVLSPRRSRHVLLVPRSLLRIRVHDLLRFHGTAPLRHSVHQSIHIHAGRQPSWPVSASSYKRSLHRCVT